VSEEAKKRAADASGSAPQEEDSVGTLPPNPELEEALREAVESVQSRPERSEEEAKQEPEEGISEGEEAPDPLVELERTHDRLLRLQADFENFRRRALAERHDIYQYGHQNLVKDLLLTVDNLERAIGHARESGGGDLESFLQGIELVRREFLGILEAHSVREVEALGKAFDPALHEAMAQAADDSVAPNTVIDVLEKGYQLRDRLLRPARVIVAKAPEPDSEDGGEAAD
jgi:molecular chaperone GrpE